MDDARLLSDEELAMIHAIGTDAGLGKRQWEILNALIHRTTLYAALLGHIEAQAERIRELETEWLVWSSEVPEQAGWYFFRGDGARIRVVEVREHVGNPFPLVIHGDMTWHMWAVIRVSESCPGVEWAGPIPAPAEPEVETKQPTTPVHPRKRHRSDIIINGWYL